MIFNLSDGEPGSILLIFFLHNQYLYVGDKEKHKVY